MSEDVARFFQVRGAVSALDRTLLRGPRRYTWAQLEERGIAPEAIETFWRAMGFTRPSRHAAAFTQDDADAMARYVHLLEAGIAPRVAENMMRGLSHHTNRLALWQTEALIEDARDREGLTDVDARARMLETLPRVLELLEKQAQYAWRRQLAFVTSRAGAEILEIEASANADEDLPLMRAVGFADLVSFTELSRDLDGRALVELVQHFEALTRDVVSQGGGRVVKTVGDQIMFVADTPEDGAQIALSLVESIAFEENLPPVRVGFVWGSMFSRYGDVYGPSVNLAARLQTIARPGKVIVDESTADVVDASLPGAFRFSPIGSHDLKGIGRVEALVVTRGLSTGIRLEEKGALRWSP